MNEMGFRQFLKKSGKKANVIEGPIHQVQKCETYLMERLQSGLETADRQGLQDYVACLAPAEVRKHMRALSLYFQFAGKPSLAEMASRLREQEIARTRQSFKLRDFRDVDLEDIAKLETLGIVTVEHMIAKGKTPAARRQLSRQTGISLAVILELVKLSDLSRLGAIKSIRARLYYEAGLDTPDKFIHWEPDALRQMLIEFVERTNFDGMASRANCDGLDEQGSAGNPGRKWI